MTRPRPTPPAPAAETGETPATTAPAADTDEMAEGDALLQDVPGVENAEQVGEEDIQEGGTHIHGTVAAAPADAVAAYETALEANGWTIEGAGGDDGEVAEEVKGFILDEIEGFIR